MSTGTCSILNDDIMGYRKIPNLYRDHTILMFRECYALEKVHGTSSNISYKDNQISFFAGGTKHETFVALFDREDLVSKFVKLGHQDITIYGEAYGGKIQGMRDTYGEELHFIAFEVKINETWLSVPDAAQIVEEFLGLEFVPYIKTTTDIKILDEVRNCKSMVAERRGCGDDKKQEGVVLRPLVEACTNNGRVIVKHKNDDFRETKTKRKTEIDPNKLKVLKEANEIANEWVTEMRLSHVLDKTLAGTELCPEHIGDIIKAMIADIKEEGKDEIVESKNLGKAIGSKTVAMLKQRMKYRG